MSVSDMQEIAAALSRLEAQQRRLKMLVVAVAPAVALAVVVFLCGGLILLLWFTSGTGID